MVAVADDGWLGVWAWLRVWPRNQVVPGWSLCRCRLGRSGRRCGRYLLGTGGGITVHSDVAEEYAESRWKAERLLRVFDGPTTESARPARALSTPTP